ncbi:2-iminobutanoate/2-iminopropanoate deaminase [Bradyrhizobium ivorense]|nr:RidA family protein [Bradyrhizobium ivorense]VIO73747.1 2-iminobutanoate/2-iminopropanoate deaminase [Bradyrhizobium ivorense]
MKTRIVGAALAPRAVGGYAQAFEITGAQRILFISGQIPETADGHLPEGFREQCRQVWANIEAQLNAADMSVANLAKVTIFLSDRRYAAENREVRKSVLGDHTPALTVVIADIFDEKWLLEIEAIAVA